MSLKISGELFSGPFGPTEFVVRSNQRPIVYAIISREGDPWNPVFRLIAVGESGEEGVSFKEHPDLDQWRALCAGEVSIYFLNSRKGKRLEAPERQALAEKIHREYDPPNGVVSIQAGV